MQQNLAGNQHQSGGLLELDTMLAEPPFDTAKIRLFKDGFTPSETTLRADFLAAEADFAGYVAPAITWSAAGVNSTGDAFAMSQNAVFAATSGATPNTITGFWVDLNVAGPPAITGVMSYFLFEVPVNMNVAGSTLGVKVLVEQPSLSGKAVVEY